MPWQNNDGDGKKGRRNPWDPQGTGGKPKNPWGEPPRSGPEDRPKSGGAPDFDEFIRRSQEKLRNLGGGNGGGGPRGGNGGGGRPNLPWGLIAGGVVLVFLATSSAYRVDAGERAVISRFGKYLVTTGPGFHLKLPTPIDHVTKVRFEHIRTTEVATLDANSENLMITGDQNIINIAYAVRWRLNSAENYLYSVADPDGTVRDATESAMREVIGRTSLNNAIGPARAAVAEEVRENLQLILDGYNSGVRVQGIDINKADPPAAVDEAFKDVSAAQQDAEQYQNQARAYAQQVEAQAAGATAAFDKVYAEYRLAPEVTRKRLYMETMETVLKRVDKTIVETPGGVQTYLPLPEVRRQAAKSAAAAENGQ
ncbi:MAG: FtsH protease activity modulator HflK [Sphingomonadaceae bacterium]